MFLSFLVMAKDEILCLAGREKEDIPYIEKYLKDELKKRMLLKKFYITKEPKKFMERVAHLEPADEVPDELTAYLLSLMV